MQKLLLLAVLCLTVAVSGCSMFQSGPRLRLKNNSGAPITNLRVLFPDAEIPFGDLAANATTEYRSVPKGVYRYAAYRYDLNGETVTQPVIDWVGEEPIQGSAFTYTLAYEPNDPQMLRIELLDIARDQ